MDRLKILVTCPPMLKMIDEVRHLYEEKNIELILPDVVQTLSEEELKKLLPTVDGWVIGDDSANRKVFESGKSGKLKAAVKWGVGIDNVDFDACKDLGIPITNTPNSFGGEVADLAMAYFIGLARNSYEIHENIKTGNWIKPSGQTIAGKTTAVIGLGDIGKNVIKRLKGFDVDIMGFDPFITDEIGGVKIRTFPQDLEKADFIILTCALTPSSKHMINKDTLSLMKPGVKIVNVARGGLIKEKDLLQFIKNGHVSAVALDVFEEEPVTLNNPLLQFSQNIFGSHNGSNTKEAVIRVSEKATKLIFEYLNI
ncbi:phosphoglycerate dehydrogenase [Croceitalea sp. MTPC9]|uniref:phosphoglycerate dehydrogenase n=1 Tax=unclassified Croceitalea TaxID=2632280 RepID=UPI002B3EE323|nr:phosphoglycerate dehydrogenase [Croceitalea sp. MTPC6]GMN16589.1 phosphoglycerate dehydrogenase [Croceitalea sp. MTPC9]